ncbi:hypothetical protein [Rurimicrobium arvi]
MEHQKPLCLRCARPMRGRTDKRFCSSRCRNLFNNKRKAGNRLLIRQINNALLRNLEILSALLAAEYHGIRLDRQQLAEKGFDFRYSTASRFSQRGNYYCFIYEYAYRILPDETIILLRCLRIPESI